MACAKRKPSAKKETDKFYPVATWPRRKTCESDAAYLKRKGYKVKIVKVTTGYQVQTSPKVKRGVWDS